MWWHTHHTTTAHQRRLMLLSKCRLQLFGGNRIVDWRLFCKCLDFGIVVAAQRICGAWRRFLLFVFLLELRWIRLSDGTKVGKLIRRMIGQHYWTTRNMNLRIRWPNWNSILPGIMHPVVTSVGWLSRWDLWMIVRYRNLRIYHLKIIIIDSGGHSSVTRDVRLTFLCVQNVRLFFDALFQCVGDHISLLSGASIQRSGYRHIHSWIESNWRIE